MTIWRIMKNTCSACGQEEEFDYYESVNVNVNPELKQKVLSRRINFFKCSKCGYEQELIDSFLYHDMRNRVMVWVLPERMRAIRIPDSSPKAIHGMIKNMIKKLGEKEFTVFGFDELFKLLDNYEEKEKNV